MPSVPPAPGRLSNTKLWPIWDIHFGWIFRNTTTNGGDMGAHVYLPWFLEHNWFPKLRLAGWSPDWYAGFPIGQYYFPVPSVAVRPESWFVRTTNRSLALLPLPSNTFICTATNCKLLMGSPLSSSSVALNALRVSTRS